MVTWWCETANSAACRSMRSKAESGSLPVAGSADAGAGAAKADAGDEIATGDRLEIGLEHTRWRHFGWAVFGVFGGLILIWKMGTVAQWIGVGLIGLGIWSTIGFVRTLLLPAGAIVVDGGRVVLPR